MTFILADGVRAVGPFETKRDAARYKETMPGSREILDVVSRMKIIEVKSTVEFEKLMESR